MRGIAGTPGMGGPEDLGCLEGGLRGGMRISRFRLCKLMRALLPFSAGGLRGGGGGGDGARDGEPVR